MNLKELSEIKNKLGKVLNDKEVHDVIIFGSFIKGKTKPEDIDIAIISDREKFKIKGFHISVISINDFFKPVGLINTLLREGYSLIRNKSFSEVYGFKNQCLFKYELSDLPASKKVQVVNFLRGRRDEKGLVLEKGGEWISNQVFLCPVLSDFIFDGFFINSKVKFKKYYVLMH